MERIFSKYPEQAFSSKISPGAYKSSYWTVWKLIANLSQSINVSMVDYINAHCFVFDRRRTTISG